MGVEARAELMSGWGYDVAVAHDRPEALSALQSRTFDVAVVDIGLPAMDGYELAQEIRKQERCKSLRLFALTGYGQREDQKRALESGFEAHLVKPVDLDFLRKTLG